MFKADDYRLRIKSLEETLGEAKYALDIDNRYAQLKELKAEQEKPEGRRTFILKDVRVFLNTLSRSIDLMKQGGIDAGVRREETEDSLILTISIPKAKGQP